MDDVSSGFISTLTSTSLSMDVSRSYANNHLRNAANYVSETVQGAGAQASKETNKGMFPLNSYNNLNNVLTKTTEVAKDSNASLSSRATAAKDALGDKVDQSSHEAKADVHKESAKH